MKRILLLWAVVAVVLMLDPGLALGQETEPLPDLVPVLEAPASASAGDSLQFYTGVSNVGEGVAVIPHGTRLIETTFTKGPHVLTGTGGFGGGPSGGVVEGLQLQTDLCVTGPSTGLTTGVGKQYCLQSVHLHYDESGEETFPAYVYPGATTSLGVSVQLNQNGGPDVDYCVTVDPDNIIAESDETNNTVCATTQVRR
jgi:hypothetical protein